LSAPAGDLRLGFAGLETSSDWRAIKLTLCIKDWHILSYKKIVYNSPPLPFFNAVAQRRLDPYTAKKIDKV